MTPDDVRKHLISDKETNEACLALWQWMNSQDIIEFKALQVTTHYIAALLAAMKLANPKMDIDLVADGVGLILKKTLRDMGKMSKNWRPVP